jgi:hypothetical protein
MVDTGRLTGQDRLQRRQVAVQLAPPQAGKVALLSLGMTVIGILGLEPERPDDPSEPSVVPYSPYRSPAPVR